MGWTNDGFYLEAHPPLEKIMTDDAWTMTALTRAFVLATEEGQGEFFSWDLAEIVALKALGVPEFVSSDSLIIRDEN